MHSTTGFQPQVWAIQARTGRKTSVPLAALAVRSPVIRPRRVTNQRLTTVAASTIATPPEAIPENTPQLATSCQGWVMNTLRPVERLISTRAPTRVRRTPMLCIRAPANGPAKP